MSDIVSLPEVSADSDATEVSTESVVEALLLSTDVPLPAAKIAQLLGSGDGGRVKKCIDTLNASYAQHGASFRVELIAKGYQLLTLPVYDRWVSKLHKVRAESRLSKAALETLAIVAYKQPVLRASVEAIRGVAVGDMLVRLREMNLVRIVGRAEEIGRPMLYGTTRRFLEVFGLASLAELPKLDQDNPDAVPPLRMVAPEQVTSDAANDSADPGNPDSDSEDKAPTSSL
ncbi:MAG: SMC-Scp complex subunit ScpB, partial [Planctomycetes bacterium]|nr:SMC-Scp complex subunit ScpB [Planctomycetota bacterium]